MDEKLQFWMDEKMMKLEWMRKKPLLEAGWKEGSFWMDGATRSSTGRRLPRFLFLPHGLEETGGGGSGNFGWFSGKK